MLIRFFVAVIASVSMVLPMEALLAASSSGSGIGATGGLNHPLGAPIPLFDQCRASAQAGLSIKGYYTVTLDDRSSSGGQPVSDEVKKKIEAETKLFWAYLLNEHFEIVLQSNGPSVQTIPFIQLSHELPKTMTFIIRESDAYESFSNPQQLESWFDDIRFQLNFLKALPSVRVSCYFPW